MTVDYLDKGHAIRLVGDHPNGRRVLDADALAEIDVRLDFGSQLLLRVDHKGKRNAMLLGEFFREIMNRGRGSRRGTCWSFRGSFARGINQLLVGKDRIAKIIAKLFRLGVEPARIHRRVKAPGVKGQRKIVTHPGNMVLGRSVL